MGNTNQGSMAGSTRDLSLQPDNGEKPSRDPSPRLGIKFKSSKSSPQIVRVINYVSDRTPDVESLGVSFDVARMILTPLSLGDLNRCMRVCKEWRSFIDTCAFWRTYLDFHYGFDICSPRSRSALHAWKYKPDCLKVVSRQSNQNLKTQEMEYVFQPFPDLWKCGVVAPYATAPAHGSLEMYHNFVKALRWLEILQDKCTEFKTGRHVQACLFPWNKPHMPHSKEVLQIFNISREVIRTCQNGSPLTRQEFASYYPLLTDRDGKPRFELKFYQWIVSMAGANSIIFDCCPRVVDPTPSFIITELSQGWIGGLLYTC